MTSHSDAGAAMTDLIALIARVAAGERTRELERDIDTLALELGWRKERPTYHAPPYFSSLDAARLLIPDECTSGKMHWFSNPTVDVELCSVDDDFRAEAPTMEAALVLAALRARRQAERAG
jgi:hypothetical protein